jgi:hypothetical protein
LGRKPYEHGWKSASKIGSRTSFKDACTTRSAMVGTQTANAVSSKQHSGSLTVIHPFHPLAGRSVEVLYWMKRGDRRMFVVDAGNGGRMTLPEQWTDRGPAPESTRFAPEALAELRAMLSALSPRCANREAGQS